MANLASARLRSASMKKLRILVKVGTNVLTDPQGRLDQDVITRLARQMASLKSDGHEVLLVSSGAVGAGKDRLNLNTGSDPVVQRQVYASIGQIALMEKYQQALSSWHLHAAQVLATKEDFRDRDHAHNMAACLLALCQQPVIPIINENDVISITELMFTDNDELAGLVAALIQADLLIILSSVDGVLNQLSQEVIPVIDADDEDVWSHVTPGKSTFGRGGMLTKLRICQRIARLGIPVLMANGKRDNVLQDLLVKAAPHTRFEAQRKQRGLKRWLAFQAPRGYALIINEGAQAILQDPLRIASLLPVGIVGIEGDFKSGDLVTIRNTNGHEIGVGVSTYEAADLQSVLGLKEQKAAIHYDYMFIF